MSNLIELSAQWVEAKAAEKAATDKRRKLEDTMRSLIGCVESAEGTETAEAGPFVVKVTSRIDRKVDAELVQEIAAEHGLSEHLATLFRWKPEINMAAWKAADESITRPLAAAITAKPGRPSFSITQIEV